MKPLPKTVGAAIGVIILISAGYISGRSTGYSQTIEQLKRETAGNLSRHVEVLARLRTGDVDGATKLLEQSVDTAVATLPQGHAYAQEPMEIQNVLMAAKTYRGAYATEDVAVNAALKDVPSLSVDHRYCSPALAALAKKSAGGGS